MRYVSIQQTIRYSKYKILNIACGPPFWTVLVSWYPHNVLFMRKKDINNFNRTSFVVTCCSIHWWICFMLYRVQITFKYVNHSFCHEKMIWHIDWRKLEVWHSLFIVLTMTMFHLLKDYTPLSGNNTYMNLSACI